MDSMDIWTDADLDQVFSFYTAYNSPTDNTPRDITALTASAGMQRQASSDAAITFGMSSGLSIENTNQVVLHVAKATVAGWTLGEYLFDLVLLDGSGRRMTGAVMTFNLRAGYAP